MMCFRDMTFCAAECVNTECFRNWSDVQQRASREWWGDSPGGPPVAFADFSVDCPEYQPKKLLGVPVQVELNFGRQT